ncbi:MAG: hypothetical protein KBC62_00830 [Candidatus Pacebacteria bacterium]|nr:hypothetical protein [Candidatus Paceibacterota bacterium]MBP9842527.1 hypothetical protein [Candidatus Paceibacterota bacterium]
MPFEPEIKLLSYKRRQSFFLILVLVFIIALPTFIFYTSGYRLSFDNEETTIVTTGGIYITTDNLEVDVYMDEAKVERPRLFRSAYYIQNLESGIHRVVVQRPGLHTWVKELPVDSNIVTEAAAFNMPELPHIRPIAEYVNQNGQGVYLSQSTSTAELFPKATTTGNFIIVTKATPSTLSQSSEYEYVADLFASSTASSSSIIRRLEEEIERFRFASTTATTTKAPTYIEQGNVRLIPRDEDIYARWIGSGPSTPHYFCTPQAASTTVAFRLGLHFAQQIEEQRLSTTTPLHVEGDRVCRSEIRIDRKWQNIKYYEFFPGTSDLIVLLLDDGLYVTEIDDRAWQNTQLIYPGNDFRAVVTDTNIYIEEDERFFELLTKIDEDN